MAYEIRKFAIIIAVAVLFSIFSFALADAFVPEAQYPSICQEAQEQPSYYEPRPLEPTNCTGTPEPSQEQIDACPGQTHLDHRTCEYQCSCYEITQAHQQQKENITFWIGIVLGSIAIIVGMLLPQKNPLNEWIGTGFIIGGVLTLFIATIRYWSELHKIARPIIIALELGIVLWIAYKRFVPEKK